MSNQGFRYVSSCVSCDRLASTAVIGWETYLLHLQYIITSVSVEHLHGRIVNRILFVAILVLVAYRFVLLQYHEHYD